MVPADLDRVLEIERRSFPTPWTRESFLYEMRGNPHGHNVVARVPGGDPVAYACFWIVGGGLQLNNLAVDEAWRSRGLGSTLVEWILAFGRARGCQEVTLEVRPSNRAALGLYRAHGFREVGRRKGYYPDTGEDAILMNRDLGPTTGAP